MTTILRYRAEVDVEDSFSPQTHVVYAGGDKRTDYLVERDGNGRRIVLENLTYFALRNIQIKRAPQRKSA